jgi:hypothetical protein
MGITGWRKKAKDRDAWKLVLKEVKVLHGPYSQKRECLESVGTCCVGCDSTVTLP